MKRNVYTTQDIEKLVSRGVTTLQLTEHDTVTAAAREYAAREGVAVLPAARATSAGRGHSTTGTTPLATDLGQTRENLLRETARVLESTPASKPRGSTAPASGPRDDWMMAYRIFLDTADVAQIRDAVSTGLIDGIATNPEKVSQSGKSYRQVVEEIRRFFNGPIAVQAVGRTTEETCACARKLHRIDPLLAIKITANKQGLAAVKILVPEGIRTNATLMFNPTQAVLAGLAGSPFISPFVGRAKMVGETGIEGIRKMRQLLDAFGLRRTNLIAASIKDVDQVIESILAGAHSVAVPFQVFEAMCEHPLTGDGLDAFTELYSRIPAS
jgi:transaldolase